LILIYWIDINILTSVGAFFHTIISQAAEILITKLLIRRIWWEEIQGEISLQQASHYEDVKNEQRDWHFLLPNPRYQRYRTFLQKKLAHDQQLAHKWFTTDYSVIQANKARYLKHLHDFQSILLVLVYGTSGGPPRGSEVPPILFANSTTTNRTLFIDRRHHLIMLRLRYSKTALRTNREQRAIRLLPESVSFLILIYMGLVMPFLQFLEVLERQGHSRYHQLLFWHKDALLHERVLHRKLKSLTHAILGQQIPIHSWRHIMQGFIRYYMEGVIGPREPTLEGELISSNIGGHLLISGIL
jgi:hypothetical protein